MLARNARGQSRMSSFASAISTPRHFSALCFFRLTGFRWRQEESGVNESNDAGLLGRMGFGGGNSGLNALCGGCVNIRYGNLFALPLQKWR